VFQQISPISKLPAPGARVPLVKRLLPILTSPLTLKLTDGSGLLMPTLNGPNTFTGLRLLVFDPISIEFLSPLIIKLS
jgi:hypothetical protein